MLAAGEVFAGRYRVHEQLAQGGMGVIYVAEHLATEEQVALKVLWPHVLASRAAVESFQLEARVTARIGGEHIVRILDAGVDEKSGLPFLAMELLRGATLRALVSKGGALSAGEAILVVRQVAKALDRAHGYVDREGRLSPIVHRDLKPENLFLAAREGAEPIVKVLDFGIAKVLSESHAVSREVRGTPLFMAYEQFTAGPITPRLDVWALGLIAFYLLAGRKYWLATARGDEEIGLLLNEILVRPLAPPGARALALGLVPGWPPEFDRWFFGCVNREPEARFGTAGAAAEALEAALTAGAGLSGDEVAAARSHLARKAALFVAPAHHRDAAFAPTQGPGEDNHPMPRGIGGEAVPATTPPSSRREARPARTSSMRAAFASSPPDEPRAGFGASPSDAPRAQAALGPPASEPAAMRAAFESGAAHAAWALGGAAHPLALAARDGAPFDPAPRAGVATTSRPGAGPSGADLHRPTRVHPFWQATGAIAILAVGAIGVLQGRRLAANDAVDIASIGAPIFAPPSAMVATAAATGALTPAVVPVESAEDEGPGANAAGASSAGAARRPKLGRPLTPGERAGAKARREGAERPGANGAAEAGERPGAKGALKGGKVELANEAGPGPAPAASAKDLYDRR